MQNPKIHTKGVSLQGLGQVWKPVTFTYFQGHSAIFQSIYLLQNFPMARGGTLQAFRPPAGNFMNIISEYLPIVAPNDKK